MDYENLSTVELRGLVRARGLARGAEVVSMTKAECVARLTGAPVPRSVPGLLPLQDGARGAAPVAEPAAGRSTVPQEAPESDNLADVIARAVSGKIQTGVDEKAVRAIVDDALLDVLGSETFAEAVKAHVPDRPPVLEINMPEVGAVMFDGEPVHFQLPQILAWLRADVPVWLWGLPGGGKTHLGRQLAKALAVPCYVMSIDETTTANKLLGFQNLVSGEFVPGWLFEPYKNGGLVVIDEIDTGNPGILAGLNALISNGHYMFPNGETVTKNPAFRVLACANTKGTGAVAGFTARQRLDAATLNRFAVLEFRYDAGLELEIACGVKSETAPWKPADPATAEECRAWVEYVQRVREYAGKNVLISPRPSLLGVRALRAGVPACEVADALLFALCASDTVNNILSNCGEPDAVTQATRKDKAA